MTLRQLLPHCTQALRKPHDEQLTRRLDNLPSSNEPRLQHERLARTHALRGLTSRVTILSPLKIEQYSHSS